MAKKTKYYVVWKGRKPGIYDSWDACKEQVDGLKGAQYMSFPTKKEAEAAFEANYKVYKGKKKSGPGLSAREIAEIGEPDYHSISVDAASGGNPGVMEYRGVDTKTKKVLFHQGPFQQGTNNVGEFLAIVHGLAFLKKRGSDRSIYTDSRTAMSWVRKRKCNTKLERSAKNQGLFDLIERAETWLRNNTFNTPIVKWETQAWGEIPADFGRK